MTNTVFYNIYRDDSSASSSRNEQISETSEEEDRRVANVEAASVYSAFSKAFLACAGPATDPNDDNSSITVKKWKPHSEQGFKEWEAEVNILGRLTHPSVVRLLGYCREDTKLLLVYELMQKGSLDIHLFQWGSVGSLSWKLRLMIMLGAARALAFLHSSEIQIIHGVFKPTDILLDGNYNAKLSGFGFAISGPTGDASHVTPRVMGTGGYAAPEYYTTGHLYVKSDVYGFGAVLLEMLTGKRVVDRNRPGRRHHLVNWMKPYLSDRRYLSRVMDPRLANQYASEAAIQATELTLKCLESDLTFRPSMNEVVECLERIQAIESTSKEP